jgi:hypothetical protein
MLKFFCRVMPASLILCFVALLTFFNLLVPKGTGADESYHLTAIWCSSEKSAGNCENLEIGEGRNNVRIDVPEVLFEGEECHVSSNSRMTSITDCNNQQNFSLYKTKSSYHIPYLYPGTLYKILGTFLILEDIVLNLEILRFVPILVICIALIGILLIDKKMLITIITLNLIIFNPFVFHLFGSFNPSLYSIIGATYIPIYFKLLIEDTDRKYSKIINFNLVILTLFLVGSRPDSMLLLIVFIALFVIFNIKKIVDLKIDRKIVLIMIVIYVLANFIYTQYKFPVSSLSRVSSRNFIDFFFDWTSFNYLFNLPGLWLGMFGYEGTGGVLGLGWYTIPVPIIVPFIQLVLVISIIAFFYPQSSFQVKITLWIIFFLFFIMVPSIPMTPQVVTTTGYYQPRYILPALSMIMTILVFQYPNMNKKFNWNKLLALSLFSTIIFIFTFQLRISDGLEIYSDWYVDLLNTINPNMWPRSNSQNYNWDKIMNNSLLDFMEAKRFSFVLITLLTNYLLLSLNIKEMNKTFKGIGKKS